MEAVQKVALLVLALLAGSAAAAREAPLQQAAAAAAARAGTLQERLKAALATTESEEGGGLADCWGALLQLHSCTNEVVLFFLNGEAYIGQECCRAIRVITHHCWPSMLTSLGFTAEEGDILHDYCDIDAAPPSPPSSFPFPPSYAPAPSPASAS